MDMEPLELVLVISACVVGAFLIGAVGVGGVIIMPALLAAGVPPPTAIVTIFCSMLPMSLLRLGLLLRARTVRVPPRAALIAAVGAGAGAGAGGTLVRAAPREPLTILVGALAALAGARDLVGFLRARRPAVAPGLASPDGSPPAVEPPAAAAHADAETPLASCPARAAPTGAVVAAAAIARKQAAGAASVEVVPEDPEEGGTTATEAATEGAEAATAATGEPASEVPSASAPATPAEPPAWEPTRAEEAALLFLALFTGFFSVLTGTGGPIIFMPLFLLWRPAASRKMLVGLCAPLATTLGAVAVVATTASGLVPDWHVFAVVCPSALVGVAIGVRVLECASRAHVQLFMACVLLAVSALVFVRVATS